MRVHDFRYERDDALQVPVAGAVGYACEHREACEAVAQGDAEPGSANGREHYPHAISPSLA